MIPTKAAFTVATCLTMLASGCSGGRTASQPGGSATDSVPAAGHREKTIDEQSLKVEFEYKSWTEVQARVAEHRGKVVVIDVWSTSCLPCLEKFLGLVELHDSHRGDVVCMSYNVDDCVPMSKELQTRILEFLKKQNATFENFVCSDSSDAFYEASKTFSIPLIFVYGRDGALAELFKDDLKKYGREGFGYDKHVAPLVAALVEAPAGGN